MALTGNAPIKFIQGEAYNYEIVFDEKNAEFVTSVYISSTKLGFCHALTQSLEDPKRWNYLFDKEESIKFLPQTTTYSITVHSMIDQLEPQILINQKIQIVENVDKQCCEV